MISSIYRNIPKSLKCSLKTLNNQNKLNQSGNKLILNSLTFYFASKRKRVIELSKVNISPDIQVSQKENEIDFKKSYAKLRKKLQLIPWQDMPFDELCALDKELIDALQIQIKKDKFNITDEQFLTSQLKNGQQIPLGTYKDLDRHYKKLFTLLKNINDFYEQFPQNEEIKKGYLHQIYITDLINDKELNQTIARFIKHIAKPEKLQAICEPTFVKYLLSVKRQLLLQGIHFDTKADKRQTRQKRQNIIQSNQKQQLPKIKILGILNYQYQFWQDVKHNRAKNGSEDDFFIETKQVPNPNQSILLQSLYPSVKMKYIARHKSIKTAQKCFCLKADLLIEIDDKIKRKIKVQWKGPTTAKEINAKKKKSINQNQQKEQEQPRVNYIVIDYENIYDGNPTIRPIFYF